MGIYSPEHITHDLGARMEAELKRGFDAEIDGDLEWASHHYSSVANMAIVLRNLENEKLD